MSSKSFLFPIIYSAIVIIATCITFYGGYADNINKVTIIGWLLIVPFCVASMLYSKRVIYHHQISGRDLVRAGLSFVVLSSLILIAFQAVFFTLDFKEYKINFMQTQGFELAKEQIRKGQLKITDAEIPALIAKEIEQVTLFRECTGIIFKNISLGLITTMMAAVAIKARIRK